VSGELPKKRHSTPRRTYSLHVLIKHVKTFTSPFLETTVVIPMRALSPGSLKDIALAFATCSIEPFDHEPDGEGIAYDLHSSAQTGMEAHKTLVQACVES
jgi:hypothetical protein